MWLLHHPISAYDQFRTDVTSPVWNFCRWVADVPHKTSPSGNKWGETSGFADWVIEQLRCPLGFILLSFAMNVVLGQRYTRKSWGKSLACGPCWQPCSEEQLAWGFPPQSKLFCRKVFHPTVVPQPSLRWNLLILKLMWQFVLNRVQQIFRCIFMSGSSDGGSFAN